MSAADAELPAGRLLRPFHRDLHGLAAADRVERGEGIHLEGLILDVRHKEIARLSRLMPSPFWVRSFVPKLEYFGVASAAS